MTTNNIRKLEDEVFALSEGELPKGMETELATLKSADLRATQDGEQRRLRLYIEIVPTGCDRGGRNKGEETDLDLIGNNVYEFLEYLGVNSTHLLAGKEVMGYAKKGRYYAIGRLEA